MEVWMLIFPFAAGYVASAYTWQPIRTFFNGAVTEAAALRVKADALYARVKP